VRHPVERSLNGLELTPGRVADGLERLVVLELNGPVAGVVAEWRVPSRQILSDPVPPLVQFGASGQQPGANLFQRCNVGAHGHTL
jgi:hypothetical protein